MNEYQLGVSHFMLLAQSMGIGFLVGLERERHPTKIAGIRTFTLIGLAGALGGFVGALTELHYVPWMLCFLVVGSLIVAQHKSQDNEPDTTTVLAGLLTFLLAYILWLGHSAVAAALTISLTAILYFRQELRNLPSKLTRQDITSFFQFAAVAFILLPILPNETYGPYDVFNPYQVGWLVVLISGISLLGYVALRLLKGKTGLYVIGLLGGLVSTTATTLVYARYTKTVSNSLNSAARVILLSHLVLFVRVAVVVAVVEVSMLKPMAPWIAGGLLAGLACLYGLSRQGGKNKQQLPELAVHNPTELKTAFGFALGFSLVLLLSAWMNDTFRDAGGYVVAFLSGLTDVDAITIANLRLVAVGNLETTVAVNAIVIAFLANLLFKLGIVLVVADRGLRTPVMGGFSLLALGVVTGLALARL